MTDEEKRKLSTEYLLRKERREAVHEKHKNLLLV